MKSHILHDSPLPRYAQLAQIVAEQMRDGTFPPGSRLPPEHSWAAEYGVSRHTVREAMEKLAREGRIRREQGRGTFVCAPSARPRGREPFSREIGLLIPCVTISLYPAIVRAVADVCAEGGYHVMIGNCDVIPDKERRYIEEFTARPVAGMIVCPSYNSELASFGPLLDRAVPFVLVDTAVEGLEGDLVSTDNVRGAREGTRRLLGWGCRCIGYLGGYSAASTSRERLQGYRAALAEADLAADMSLVREGGFTAGFGQEATRRLLAECPELDGLLVANDPIAAGAVRTILDSGRRIPEDIRICTFDEPELGPGVQPPLLTIRQARRETGRCAAELLLARIGEARLGGARRPVQTVRIPAAVVEPAPSFAPAGAGAPVAARA